MLLPLLVPTTPGTTLVPPPPQQGPTPVAKPYAQGGKAKRKEPKDKSPKPPPSPKAQKKPPPCAVCEVVGMPPITVLSFLISNL